MKYKIFQTFYKQDQCAGLDHEFTAYNNLKNERPELREYHLFKSAIEDGSVDGLDAWGFFSTKWKAKTKIQPDDFINWMHSNPNHDVYFINHSIIQEAVSVSVWEQGDWWHRNISNATQSVLDVMNVNVDLKTMMMSTDTYCFCSYFVASRAFWQDYIKFLDEFIRCIDLAGDKTKSIINTTSSYDKDMTLNYFPFIVERLFSTFLYINRNKYKIINFPSQYQAYTPKMGSLVQLVESLSLLKKMSIQLKDQTLFDSWMHAREVFLKKYTHTFEYEKEDHYDANIKVDIRRF